MAYLSDAELRGMGFAAIGVDVKISTRCAVYDPGKIRIGDHSRIDDFCVISGNLTIGKYCHVTPQCLIAGGAPGVVLEDFCTLAYGVRVFAQTDDYSGETMTNSLIPKRYKNETLARVLIGSQCIVGTGSVIMPGVTVAEGCAIGAMSLVRADTAPWGIYAGIPVRRLRDRSRRAHDLKLRFIADSASHDPL